jgi:hypothetical protein
MRTKARLQMRLGTAALAALVVAGCGGGEGTDAGHEAPESVQNAQRRQALASATTATSSVRPVGTTALLDWAERNYPQFFPGHQDDQSLSPYTYRYYPQTGNYVGVADGRAVIYGPVSGGALTDVGAVSDFRCLVYALDCQPNPLLAAKWQTGVALETGDDEPIIKGLGIDDAGRATVLFTQRRNGVTRLFASQTLAPDANGLVAWTAQQALDDPDKFSAGSNSGYSIGTAVLNVAANGVVVATWAAQANCLPGTYNKYEWSCRYVMVNRFDPATRMWSGARRILDSDAADSDVFSEAQVDRDGNFALVQQPHSGDRQLAYWAAGSAQPVKVAMPVQGLWEMQLGIAGQRLVLAGEISRNSTYDIVAYRGTVEGGFGVEELLEKRNAVASFKRLVVSPAGRAVVVWSQSNGTRDTVYIADAASPAVPFVTADQGQAIYSDLYSSSENLSFNDAGELIMPARFSTSCVFHRRVDGQWVKGSRWSTNSSLCPSSGGLARNRNGDLLDSTSKGWYVVDARTDTASQPAAMKAITPGPDGVRLGSGRAALSVNGTAVYVAIANYDVLPTAAEPAGDGRSSVSNLWGWVLR